MKHTLIAAALCATTGAAQAITIEFDYTYDFDAFFSDEHKALLDTVASQVGGRLTDSLAAINSGGGNTYQTNVGTLYTPPNVTLTNPESIDADTVRVYVGSRALSGSTLAIGSQNYNFSGTSDFADLVRTRGQSASAEVDFAPVTGVIVFDNDAGSDWYLDDDLSTTGDIEGNDFYSVVLHEVFHILGVGIGAPWGNQVSVGGNVFTGPAARAENGGADVPLFNYGHVDGSLMSTTDSGIAQQPAMSPFLTVGTRKYATALDWALLSDVGWQVSAVPEAHTWAMMLAGLGLLGWHARRRRA